MDQEIILNRLRSGHSRAQIGAAIAQSEGIGMRDALDQVHAAATSLVEVASTVDRPAMLAELIESTKAVQRAAFESENYSVALNSINTLAKLTGLLQ